MVGFRLTAWSVFDDSAFEVRVEDKGFGSFILIELQFDFLFEEDSSAGAIPICNIVLAFVGVVTIFEAALASGDPRSVGVLLH